MKAKNFMSVAYMIERKKQINLKLMVPIVEAILRSFLISYTLEKAKYIPIFKQKSHKMTA